MKCYVAIGAEYDIVDAEPVCGDYCDSCGDCLVCQGCDPCPYSEDGEHLWVVYEFMS